MARQKITKLNERGCCYQVCVTGDENWLIYTSVADYRFFMSLLEKYLTNNDSVEALAYCLAPDYFCLLLDQTNSSGAEKLVHDLIGDYNIYFYNKFQVKDLFLEKNYKITKVLDSDLLDASRNVHIDLDDWIDCQNSSIRAYLYDDAPSWLNKSRITKLYGSAINYLDFLRT